MEQTWEIKLIEVITELQNSGMQDLANRVADLTPEIMDALNTAREDGYCDGRSDGYDEGYSEGYAADDESEAAEDEIFADDDEDEAPSDEEIAAAESREPDVIN